MNHYLFLSKKTIFVAALLLTFIASYAQNQTINGSVTWSSSRTINGLIVVKTGGTLTINAPNVYLGSNSAITVERGGNILLNNRLANSRDALHLNLKNFASGVYIVNILSEDNVVYTNKLIIK